MNMKKNYDFYSKLLESSMDSQLKRWKNLDTDEQKQRYTDMAFELLAEFWFDDSKIKTLKDADNKTDKLFIKALFHKLYNQYFSKYKVELTPYKSFDNYYNTICKSDLLKRPMWTPSVLKQFNPDVDVKPYTKYRTNGTISLYKIDDIVRIEQSDEFKEWVSKHTRANQY